MSLTISIVYELIWHFLASFQHDFLFILQIQKANDNLIPQSQRNCPWVPGLPPLTFHQPKGFQGLPTPYFSSNYRILGGCLPLTFHQPKGFQEVPTPYFSITLNDTKKVRKSSLNLSKSHFLKISFLIYTQEPIRPH